MSPIRIRSTAILLSAAGLVLGGCGAKRLAVVGPMRDVARSARSLEENTRLEMPVRIDFTWELKESGARVHGVGVARVEPPYRARLDLFLDNGEGVIAVAIVEDDLRMPHGAPYDILPPVDLMWGTLGVFRPMGGTRLVGGDRLEGQAERLRYRYLDGEELHYEVDSGSLRSLELLEGASVIQWVRLSHADGSRYPTSATYRNLGNFRELKIDRESVKATNSFDPAIWDLEG